MKCFACKREIPGEAVFCPFCREPQGFDQSLIDFARAGDQDAISELYRRTYENVYYTVRALIRDEDTVLDLVQDSFVKAFENLDKLHDPNKFRAWVKRIGHNLAVDYTRRSRPLLFSQMTDEESEMVLSFPDDRPENLPDVALDRRETTRLVNQILGSLSEDQRLVVGMYYYEQRSVREIARELGVSENTVKSRLFQGRKKIETRVKVLEAQGTRLYSLTPTAFLLLLLRNQELFRPPVPAEGILSAVLRELGCLPEAAASGGSAASGLAGRAAGRSASRAGAKAAAGTGAKAAAGAGVKAAAGAAGKALAVKVIALVASAAVVVSGGALAVREVTQNRAAEPETVEIVAEDPGSAGALPAEEVLSDEERYAVNRILSSFAEWPWYHEFSYSGYDGGDARTRDVLVRYAYWNSRFQQPENVYQEGGWNTIRLDTVNNLLDRRFGVTLSVADAEDFTRTNEDYAHYSYGSFYFPVSVGDCYNRLSLVREVEPRGNDTYALSFDFYYLDFDRYEELNRSIPADYYRLTAGQAARDPDLSKQYAGEAVVQRYERDGRTEWRVLSYRLGEEEPLTLDHMQNYAIGDKLVQVPVFRGEKSEEVNVLVYDAALEASSYWDYCKVDDQDPNTDYNAQYEAAVTLLDGRTLSVAFYGTTYTSSPPVFRENLGSLNLDLETLRPLTLQELYRVDDPGFLQAVCDYGGYVSEPVGTIGDEEDFDRQWSQNRTQRDWMESFRSCVCFLKPEGLVLSTWDPGASGQDYFPVLVPYEALEPYRVGDAGPTETEEPLTVDGWRLCSTERLDVLYPHFRGRKSAEVNAIVCDCAEEISTSWEGVFEGPYTGGYKYAVTLLNDRVLSVVFWGETTQTGTFTSRHGIRTLNLDLQTLQPFELGDLYRIDDPGFVEAVYQNGRLPGEPETGFPTVPDYGWENKGHAWIFDSLFTAFREERRLDNTVQYAHCFLKPEGLVLSVYDELNHYCDHFEVLVPYEALEPWYIGPFSREELTKHRMDVSSLDPELREAYLRQLQSREEDILTYERRSGGEGIPSVVLHDLTGDGEPELLYVTAQEGAGGAFLWIYRYENGEAVKCGQFTWEAEAGQERLACLFQQERDPTLYAEYTDPAGGAWSDRVLRFDPDGTGGLRQIPFAREQSFSSGAMPEYFVDGMAFDEGEYRERMDAFYSRVSRVLIFDQQSVLEDRVDSRLAGLPSEGMSYREAVELLRASGSAPAEREPVLTMYETSVFWGPELFRNSSWVFNVDLALVCAQLSRDAYDYRTLLHQFRNMGVNGLQGYNYTAGEHIDYTDENCFFIAHDRMKIDGKDTAVLLIVCRGTNQFGEMVGDWAKGHVWEKTNNVNGVKVYNNVYNYYKQVMTGLERYLKAHSDIYDAERIVLVVTGHSLGGAAANLVGADITYRIGEDYLFFNRLRQSDVYVYTYGAIKVTADDKRIGKGFENIHNVYNFYDSFGPYGNYSAFEASSFYYKFGHTELYSDERFHYEENNTPPLPTWNNHDMENYIDALFFEKSTGGLLRYACSIPETPAPTSAPAPSTAASPLVPEGTYVTYAYGFITNSFTFYGDHRVSMNALGMVGDGTYVISGGEIVITYKTNLGDASYQWRASFRQDGSDIYIAGDRMVRQP